MLGKRVVVQQDGIDIRTGYMIINGLPTEETISEIYKSGNEIIGVWDADRFHPYATKDDIVIFYAKPINKDQYDEHMKQFREAMQYEANVDDIVTTVDEPIRDDNAGKIRVVDESIPMDIEIDSSQIIRNVTQDPFREMGKEVAEGFKEGFKKK